MDLMSGISLIARHLRIYAERSMNATIDLSFPEMQVLMALSGKKEANQEQIAQIIGIDKSSVAKTLSKLEGRSLVTRRQNPVNKRENLVSLAPDAACVLKGMGDVYSAWEDDVFAGVEPADRKTFEAVLETLTANSSALVDGSARKER